MTHPYTDNQPEELLSKILALAENAVDADILHYYSPDLIRLIKKDRADVLSRLESGLPKSVNGEELNITVQATSLAFADPHIVKVAQGEGWDMALAAVRALVEESI